MGTLAGGATPNFGEAATGSLSELTKQLLDRRVHDIMRTSLKSLAARAAVIAALGVGGTVVGEQSASASLGDCNTGRVCLWVSANFVGTATQYSSTTGPISVTAQSRYNKTTKCAAYYGSGGLIATGAPNTGWGSGQHTYTSITITTC